MSPELGSLPSAPDAPPARDPDRWPAPIGSDLSEQPPWLVPTLWALLGVAALGGVYGRISGLGFSPLADDEYYFFTSIQAILERGIPELEAGGIYTRGILIQYLTAPLFLLISDEELALRIPSVLLGLGTVVLGYLYGRRTVGHTYALCLTVLLLLSSWQIEFSRFGRMYAGLQFLSLAFLLALHDTLDSAGEPRRYVAHVLCVLGILVHQLAVFLLPLLLLPFLRPQAVSRFGGRAAALRYAGATGLAFVAVFVYRKINFRSYGVEAALPGSGISGGGGGSGLSSPSFPFWHMIEAPTVNLIVAAAVLFVVAAIAFGLYRSGRLDAPAALGCVLVAAAIMHLLMIALLLLVLIAARYRIHRTYRDHRAAAWTAALGAGVAIAWVGYAGLLTFGLGSRGWIQESGSRLFREAFREAFMWPDPGPAVIEPWAQELPIMAALLAGALLVQTWSRAREPLPELLRNPAIVVIYVVLVFGLFEPLYQVTRYTYFIYPVALAALALSVKDVFEGRGRPLARRWVGALGVPALLLGFACTEDFNPSHILHVDSFEATYRIGQFERFATTWYNRDDFAAPADFLAATAGPKELIVVEEAPAVSHYLEREHAVYLDRRGTRFRLVSRDRGTRDLWSNQRLLSTPTQLYDYTQGASVVWIVRAAQDRKWIQPDDVWGGRLINVERPFLSPDGALEVLRVRLRDRSARQSHGEPAGTPSIVTREQPARLSDPGRTTL